MAQSAAGQEKKVLKAIYIPLADHYAGIVAYENYRDKMNHADYEIERMKSWARRRRGISWSGRSSARTKSKGSSS